MSTLLPVHGRVARRGGFSIIELLVILLILLALIGVLAPAITAWQNSNVKAQMTTEVMVAMQTNATLCGMNRKADADSGSPRLPGISYAGTALFFDSASGLIRFSNHNQYAKDKTDYLALRTFSANGFDWPENAYDILKSAEPVAIRGGIGIAGIILNDNGFPADPTKATLRLQAMPFAVCCRADSYGLPPAPAVFCDLADDGTYQQVPTAAPAVVVYRRSDVAAIGANPDDLATLPGATDQAKLNALIFQCGGQLVQLAPQNGTAVDF